MGWIEIILMPLVVVIMGSFCTYFISRSQTNMSRELEIINQKIKILDIASRYMTDENESKRICAVKLLKIVDPDIAGEMLKIIEESTEETLRVRSVAQEVGNTVEQKGQKSDDSDLKEKNAFPLVASVREKDNALNFAREIINAGQTKYKPEVYLAENGWYVVSLGGYLGKSEADQRVAYAKSTGIAPDAFVWRSNNLGKNLLKPNGETAER